MKIGPILLMQKREKRSTTPAQAASYGYGSGGGHYHHSRLGFRRSLAPLFAPPVAAALQGLVEDLSAHQS